MQAPGGIGLGDEERGEELSSVYDHLYGKDLQLPPFMFNGYT